MQRRRRLLSILALASSFAAPLLVTRAAHAQGWLADRKYAEGIGIKAGDFELHPGIGISAGIDSNWFNRTYNAGYVNSDPLAAGIFAITPSFYMSTLGPQRKEGDVNAAPPTVDFRLGASATYRAFVGDQPILDQNGLDGLSADFNGKLVVLPKRPFSFDLQAGYDRTINPNATGNPDQNFNRNLLNVGAGFTITPGGGTLDWKFGYNGNFAFFDQSGGQAPFNNLQNTILTRGTWKFSPKTAVIYDGNFAFVNYTQQSQAFNGLQNSTPLRSRLGLNGLIGSRFGLTAFAGYGGSFAQTPAAWGASGNTVSQYDSVIGQLEGKFYLTANPASEQNPNAVGLAVSSLSIGYARDFSQSYLGSYYGSDRGYLKFAFFFGGRALVSIEGGGGAREYPQIYDNTGATIGPGGGFVDGAVDATLFAEYRFTNTLGLNLTGKYTEEISSTVLPADSAGDRYHMAFRRFEAYLGFRWFM
jgi:hypothetical protein